jgi:hypothetical protein
MFQVGALGFIEGLIWFLVANCKKRILEISSQFDKWFFTIFVHAKNIASCLNSQYIGLSLIFDLKGDSGRDRSLGNVAYSVGERGLPTSQQ